MDLRAVTAAVGAALLASCADPAVLRVGVDPHSPPMEYRNDDDSMAGFDLDLMRAIADTEGLHVEFVAGTWSGLFAQVEDGGLLTGLDQNTYDAVISSALITNERRVKYAVSDSYLNVGQRLIVPWDSTAVNLDDLKDSSIGVTADSRAADIVFRTYNAARDQLRVYNSPEQALGDLLERRIGGVVASPVEAARAFQANQALKAALRLAGPALTDDENLGIYLKNGNTELLSQINDGLVRLRASGRYYDLLDRWALR